MPDRRVLDVLPASATVIANMIGTGIFTTTGLMIYMGAGAGDILLAWLLGGIIALCGALCYGELGANLPYSGGEYLYISRLLHPSLGFMAGWVSLLVGFAAPVAAAAMALNLYMATVIGEWPVRLMAALTILGVAILHSYDLSLGAGFQTALTLIKIALIIAFISGIFLGTSGEAEANSFTVEPGFLLSSPFAVVLVFVSFAYSGWNAVAYIGAELKRPERTLPWSTVFGTGLVGALYLLLNYSYLAVVPAGELSGVEEVGSVVASRLWGPAGGQVVSSLIALTLICPISAMLFVGPRVAEAMALDGFLPSAFARLNRRNVPAYAVTFQAVIAVLVTITSSFGPLLIYIGFTLNIFAALTVASLFRLRRTGRSKYKICIGYPVTPIIFLGFTIWITIWSIGSQPLATIAGLATLMAGYSAYLLRSRKAQVPLGIQEK